MFAGVSRSPGVFPLKSFSVKARDPEGCSSANRNDQSKVLFCSLGEGGRVRGGMMFGTGVCLECMGGGLESAVFQKENLRYAL